VCVVVVVGEVEGGEVGLEALGRGGLEGLEGWKGGGVGVVGDVAAYGVMWWRWCDGRERWAAWRGFVVYWTRRCRSFERACGFLLR
jgi:hypothetical protein